jgi:hypothetical protein
MDSEEEKRQAALPAGESQTSPKTAAETPVARPSTSVLTRCAVIAAFWGIYTYLDGACLATTAIEARQEWVAEGMIGRSPGVTSGLRNCHFVDGRCRFQTL